MEQHIASSRSRSLSSYSPTLSPPARPPFLVIPPAHLSGFRELAAAHARGSSAYAAAAELLSKTLSAAVQRFHDAHGGKAATQVTFVSAEEEEEEEAKVTLHQAAGRMLIKGENDGAPLPSVFLSPI